MKNILAITFSILLFTSQVIAWGNTCSSCTNNQNLLRVGTWSIDQSSGFTTNNADRFQGSLDYLRGSNFAGLNLNLICLQELYDTSSKQSLIDRLRDSYPYSFSAPPGNLPDCDPSNTQCTQFNGNSGTLILSTLPFQDSKNLNFQTQSNVNSNALYVKVSWNDTPVNFFCTDLLPDDIIQSGVNYENLNMAQTQELLNWVNTNVPNNEPVILAGDFNSGPAIGNNAGVFVNNYNLFITAGYQSALISSVPSSDVPCSSCNINGQNSITSHIFVKSNTNPEGCVATVGVFATDATVTTSQGTVVPLSDTVGVFTGVCYGPSTAPPPAAIESPIVIEPVQTLSSGTELLPLLIMVTGAFLALIF